MVGGKNHRPTLKQKNKSHSHGKHRSKRNLKQEARGKFSHFHKGHKVVNAVGKMLYLLLLRTVLLIDRQHGSDVGM